MHSNTEPPLSHSMASEKISGETSGSTVSTKTPQALAPAPESSIKTCLPTKQQDQEDSDSTHGASKSSKKVPPRVPDVPGDQEIEKLGRDEDQDGIGIVNEATAAANVAQDGAFYRRCRNLWAFLYGTQFGMPYFLIEQTVLTLVLALFCAYKARGVCLNDPEFACVVATTAFYVNVLWLLFGVKEQMATMYENARTNLAQYLCVFKVIRAALVVAMLRLFVHISDILSEKKHLDGYALGFYYLSGLHVISVAKLFTVEDILCLSDSLIAVGVLVSSRIEAEDLGTTDYALQKKMVLLVCGYASVVLIICFKFATIPYGHQPEDLAAGPTQAATGPGNEDTANPNDAQYGDFYTLCRDLWAFLYGTQFGRPYFLIEQTVITLVLAMFCAYKDRGVSLNDPEFAYPAGALVIYVNVLWLLFSAKQQMATMYENARTNLAQYLCVFKVIRAILFVCMLRLFVRISDILGEKKHLDAYALSFYYLSSLQVITVAKLFTVEDILGLSDSLVAVGVLVSSKIEREGLGTADYALLKKVVLLACGYASVVLIICFKFATIPYGHQPADPARGATENGTEQGIDAAV